MHQSTLLPDSPLRTPSRASQTPCIIGKRDSRATDCNDARVVGPRGWLQLQRVTSTDVTIPRATYYPLSFPTVFETSTQNQALLSYLARLSRRDLLSKTLSTSSSHKRVTTQIQSHKYKGIRFPRRIPQLLAKPFETQLLPLASQSSISQSCRSAVRRTGLKVARHGSKVKELSLSRERGLCSIHYRPFEQKINLDRLWIVSLWLFDLPTSRHSPTRTYIILADPLGQSWITFI